MKRRDLLKALGAVGAGLVVGVPLSGCQPFGEETPVTIGDGVAFNAFLRITPSNEIHFYQPRAEMGQGVRTGLTILIAEGLSVAPDRIQLHHVGVDEAYRLPGQPMQLTGGSTSLKDSFAQLIQAGATAKAALHAAAAVQLGVDAGKLRLADGQVWLGDRAYAYGDFVETAAQRPLPAADTFPTSAPYRYIGKPGFSQDALAKSTGTAVFAIDVDVPDRRVAVVIRCPVAGGQLARFDPTGVPEGVELVALPHGVGVVAPTYWRARQAATQLKVEWTDLPLASESTDSINAKMLASLDNDAGQKAETEGDVVDALTSAAKTLSATYSAPHLAHATMEPLNCTISFDAQARTASLWVGSQVPDLARAVAAHFLEIDPEQVTVHSTFLGGGFGRRLYTDFVAEAAQICRATGYPIQLVWSREDDIRHDHYRPSAMMRFEGGLDAEGQLIALSAKRSGADALAHFIDASGGALLSPYVGWTAASWLGERSHSIFKRLTVDATSVEGLMGTYSVPHTAVHHVTVDAGIPVGFWRSVGHSYSAFGIESFIDELAHAAGQDPVAFRLRHLDADPRMKSVIQLAASKAGWGAQPSGQYMGIAAHHSFDTWVAQVVSLSIVDGNPRVHRVTCAVDCGLAVTPDVIRQQIAGGVIFGLTAALHGEITFKDGAVVQSNFHDYPLLRLSEAPDIDVHIVDSNASPTGVGEPGVPPSAPAVANAIFAATGKRLRQLPLRLDRA